MVDNVWVQKTNIKKEKKNNEIMKNEIINMYDYIKWGTM